MDTCVEPRPTVFVVDDDEAVRCAVSLLIRSVGFEVETYASAQEFIDAYDERRPGCLVLDLRMPGMGGLELQEKLSREGSGIPVIIITGHGDVPMAVRAIKRGAVDFLEKPFDDRMLIDRVHQAIDMDARRRERDASRVGVAAQLARLTPREQEVMHFLVEGKGNKEVAFALGLSRKTVDIHRAHIMMKLGADSIVDLVRMSLLEEKISLA